MASSQVLYGPYEQGDGTVYPQGTRVTVCESPHAAEQAVHKILTMNDRNLAIDLEWKPDFRPSDNNRVAVISIANSRGEVVLFLTSQMDYKLPPALKRLLTLPRYRITWLSYSWSSNDEAKFKMTFGFGAKDFGGDLIDLRILGEQWGYKGRGLAGLCEEVLGIKLHKDKKVTRANWRKPYYQWSQQMKV